VNSPESNIRSIDRKLSLAPIEGKSVKNSSGLVDTRLFTGDQQLLLKMDPQTCLWYFQYTNTGLLPEPLKGKFTGFKAGLRFAEDYFSKRNIRITRVED